MRQVGEAELFGNRVGDVDVWRLSVLKSILDGLDEGTKDVVVGHDGCVFLRAVGVRKHLGDDPDRFPRGI